MRDDPITLYVAAQLDKEFANGTIYMDDGISLNYANKSEFLYWSFTYKKLSDSVYTIQSKQLDKSGTYDPDVYIEKIVIRGVRYYPRNVHLYYDGLFLYFNSLSGKMYYKANLAYAFSTNIDNKVENSLKNVEMCI